MPDAQLPLPDLREYVGYVLQRRRSAEAAAPAGANALEPNDPSYQPGYTSAQPPDPRSGNVDAGVEIFALHRAVLHASSGASSVCISPEPRGITSRPFG